MPGYSSSSTIKELHFTYCLCVRPCCECRCCERRYKHTRDYRTDGILTVVSILQWKQANRRSHFAHTVHSHHPLPSRSHLQRTPQRRNDPFCCTTSLAIEWSLLQRTRYSALSMGKKTPKTAPSPWDFATLPEEDRATAIGNMHRKMVKIAHVVPEILRFNYHSN